MYINTFCDKNLPIDIFEINFSQTETIIIRIKILKVSSLSSPKVFLSRVLQAVIPKSL